MHVVNTVSSVNSVRHKSGTGTITPTSQNVGSPGASAAATAAGAVGNVALPVGGQNQFQRLKVEDALSYLDQVGNQCFYPITPSQYLQQVSASLSSPHCLSNSYMSNLNESQIIICI